jgi:hypothetical protein
VTPAAPPVRTVLAFPADRSRNAPRTRRSRAPSEPVPTPCRAPDPALEAVAAASGRLAAVAFDRLPASVIERLADGLAAAPVNGPAYTGSQTAEEAHVLLSSYFAAGETERRVLASVASALAGEGVSPPRPHPIVSRLASALDAQELDRLYASASAEARVDIVAYARGRVRRDTASEPAPAAPPPRTGRPRPLAPVDVPRCLRPEANP